MLLPSWDSMLVNGTFLVWVQSLLGKTNLVVGNEQLVFKMLRVYVHVCVYLSETCTVHVYVYTCTVPLKCKV